MQFCDIQTRNYDFFSELWDINSLLRIIKSSFEGEKTDFFLKIVSFLTVLNL